MPDAAGSAGGDPTAGDDTSQGADGSDDSSQQAGYTVCIMVDAQNKISVSVQPGTDDNSDGDDDNDGDSTAQPVSSLNDLVTLVKSIIRAGGQMPDGGDGQADFAAGAGESSGQ